MDDDNGADDRRLGCLLLSLLQFLHQLFDVFDV